jgi:hypothetical protein
MGLIFVTFSLLSLTQGVVRQLMQLGVLYFLTAIVGFLYPIATYYLSFLAAGAPAFFAAMLFIFLLFGFMLALQTLLQRWFPDTRLPRLGVFDAILALGPGIITAMILVSLLLSAIGYGTEWSWGAYSSPIRGILAESFDEAISPVIAGEFMRFYLITHPWFLPNPPPLLGYLLPESDTPDGP